MVEWPKSTAADQKRFETAIEAARWEIARSVAWGFGEEPPAKDKPAAVLNYLQTKAPPVYDPFCGGGSIPLEAQRLGLRAYGSDLNPVAVLITKALIEFPPKFAGLAACASGGKGRLRTGRVRRASRRTCAATAGGCATRRKSVSGISIPRSTCGWKRSNRDRVALGSHRDLSRSRPKGRRMCPLFPLTSSPLKAGNEAIVVPVKDPAAKDGWRFEVKTRRHK